MLDLPDWPKAWDAATEVAASVPGSVYDRLLGKDEEWASSVDIAESQAARCQFDRGSPWWIHAYLCARYLRGTRSPRNAAEALILAVAVRNGLEEVDDEYVRRMDGRGAAPANYGSVLTHTASLLGSYCLTAHREEL